MKQFYPSVNVKYHGATNARGSRVSITCNVTGTRKYISYDYSYCSPVDMAKEYFESLGVNVITTTETKDAYILLLPCSFDKIINGSPSLV